MVRTGWWHDGSVITRRSAAKKRAEKALSGCLAGDAVRMLVGDTSADWQQVVRTLADTKVR
jgi:hypothetical protein